MKRHVWWLICIVISPLAAVLSDAALEQLLSKATLKPRNEIDDAGDAFRLQLHSINRSRKGIDNEDFSDF